MYSAIVLRRIHKIHNTIKCYLVYMQKLVQVTANNPNTLPQ